MNTSNHLRRWFYGLLAPFLFLIGGVFVAGGVADNSGRRVRSPTFTVKSSAPEYDRYEPIVLTLTLDLDERFRPMDRDMRSSSRLPTAVTVATFHTGTISVVEATRNGEPIEPSIGAARFDERAALIQVASLTTIAPGEQAQIPFDLPLFPSFPPAVWGGSRLVVRQFHPDGRIISSFYSLALRGEYTLQFLYKYTGPTGGLRNVFRGELLSNPVTFVVR